MFSLGDARTTETTEGWLAVQDCAKKKEYIDECSFTLKSIKFLFTWASTSGAPGLKIFREAVLKSPGVLRGERRDRRAIGGFIRPENNGSKLEGKAISRGLPKHVLVRAAKSVFSALNIDSGDWRDQTRILKGFRGICFA